mmetsp:Transcript_38947/g.63667  ORF Transcript_38947/g.63667 Transcript_38947/m.63667 type:complete len:130 (+) Transcript_38947:806-1195(+)
MSIIKRALALNNPSMTVIVRYNSMHETAKKLRKVAPKQPSLGSGNSNKAMHSLDDQETPQMVHTAQPMPSTMALKSWTPERKLSAQQVKTRSTMNKKQPTKINATAGTYVLNATSTPIDSGICSMSSGI